MMQPSLPKHVWAVVSPRGKVLCVDLHKRWATITLGVLTGHGARTEEYWNERGYRIVKLRLCHLPTAK